MKQPCSIDGCGRPSWSRGWCRMHYERWRIHGNPQIVFKHKTPHGIPMAWLLKNAHTTKTDECLTWPFGKNEQGYGTLSGRIASRVMCQVAHGPPPSPKHETAHSCGKGHEACVNPNHLRWATRAENQADSKLHGTAPIG